MWLKRLVTEWGWYRPARALAKRLKSLITTNPTGELHAAHRSASSPLLTLADPHLRRRAHGRRCRTSDIEPSLPGRPHAVAHQRWPGPACHRRAGDIFFRVDPTAEPASRCDLRDLRFRSKVYIQTRPLPRAIRCM